MNIYEHNPSPEAQPDKQKQKQISQRRNINMINVSAHMLSVRLPTADMSQRASAWFQPLPLVLGIYVCVCVCVLQS